MFSRKFFSQQFKEFLQPIKKWLDNLEIENTRLALLISRIIPASCPFEREIVIFDTTIFRIPPLCKFNPFYEQFIWLRFRALSYLEALKIAQ